MNPTATDTNPEAFKSLIVGKYPNGVSSDGTRYADMQAQDLTQRIVTKYPNGVTNDGRKYADFLQPAAPAAPAAPTPTITGPTGSGILSSIGKSITGAGVGVGSAIGQAGLGIAQLGAKGIGAIAGVTGGQQGTKSWNDIGDQIGNISKSVYGAPVEQTKQTAPLSTLAGQGLGTVATILSPGRSAVSAVSKLPVLQEARNAQQAVKIAEDVAPKLTAKGTAEALANGGATKSPILGRIKLTPDSYTQKMADTVQKYVPNFSSMKTYADKVNATRTAAYKEAENLKNAVVSKGADRIYSFKELGAKMNAVEKPIAIKSDAVLTRQFDLAKKAALAISKKNGGKISNLLDARKEFDALVEKEFPHLYDRENAPMRSAITSMRGAMNDFIAQNLPEVGFKDSLGHQSKLFSAVDNLAEKAAAEVGTSRFGRLTSTIKAHPVGAGVIGGLGTVAGYNEAKKFLPFLP